MKTTWGKSFHLSLCSCFQYLMHCQTFSFWAWKQNSTKKHSVISFFRIPPGMLAMGMLTGKPVRHHMSTLMPAVTPHLTGLGCFSFSSCFCFTPSCGGTKHKLFQSFIKVKWSCSSWFGHLSFVCLKNLLSFIGLACSEPGMSMITSNTEGKGSIPGIWPHSITAYFGMAQSSFFLSVWLFRIAGRKWLLSVWKVLYYPPVPKKYPCCH